MPLRPINEKVFYPSHKETLSLVIFPEFGGTHWRQSILSMFLGLWKNSKTWLMRFRFENSTIDTRYLRFWSSNYLEITLLPSISRNSLQTPSSDDILFGNVTWSTSVILVEYLIRWKRGLKHFLLNIIWVIFETKILPNKSLIKNICISVTHPILFRSVDTVSIIL